MKASPDRARLIAERLRRAGLRATAPRVAILTELDANRAHPNAQDLHRAIIRHHPSLSLSTVYLTLEALADAGLVRRLMARDGRLRVDGTLDDHAHATCRGCGEVFDVAAVPVDQQLPPAGLPRGVKFIGARMEFDVLCRACRPRRRPGTHLD